MTKTETIPAWAAFLNLPSAEREGFLAAASAFTIASASEGENRLSVVPPQPVVTRRDAARPRVQKPVDRTAIRTPAVITGALDMWVPLVGGADLDLAPRADFAREDFIRRWRPGKTIYAYVASVAGLGTLMRPLGQSAYSVSVDIDPEGEKLQALKPGTTRDVNARMIGHNRYGHGSVSKANPRVETPGFRGWMPEALPVAALEPSPLSPVSVCGNSLEIILPKSMTPEAYDRRFATRLAGASLAGWAMSAEGRAICTAHGIDPKSLVRGTPKPDGSVAWCAEIILIRVRHDALRLLRICEQIIIDCVAAGPVPDGATGDEADAASPANRPRARRQPGARRSASATPVVRTKTGQPKAR